MAKLTLSTVTSGFSQLTALNANFTAILTSLQDKVLWRNNPSGEPNQMENSIDMNNFPILNLGTSTAGSSPVTWDDLADLQDSIEYSPVLADIANNEAPQTLTESRSAVLTDAYSYLRTTSASAINFTIDPDSTTDFRDGVEITIRQQGSGLVTIVEGSGVTINVPVGGTLVLGGEGATVTLKKATDNEWDLMGQVLAA